MAYNTPHNRKPGIFAFYFSFYGRINRQKYWLWFVLPSLPCLFILAVTMSAAGFKHHEGFRTQIAEEGVMSAVIYYIIPVWIWFAVSVKRLHDCNISGLWLLCHFALLPVLFIAIFTGKFVGLLIALSWIVGIIHIVLWFFKWFMPGTDGLNSFGNDPLEDVKLARAERLRAEGAARMAEKRKAEIPDVYNEENSPEEPVRYPENNPDMLGMDMNATEIQPRRENEKN